DGGRLRGGAGGAAQLRRVAAAELFERGGESSRVVGSHDGAAPIVDDLGAAGDGARYDGQAARERLEMNVTEGLVACGKHQHVRGSVPTLDIGPRSEPHHAPGDAELAREASIRRGVASPEDQQPRAAVAEMRERADRRRQALALESAAG